MIIGADAILKRQARSSIDSTAGETAYFPLIQKPHLEANVFRHLL